MINYNLNKILSLTGAKPVAMPSVIAVAISIALGTMSSATFAQATDSNPTDSLTQLQARVVQGPDTDADGIADLFDLDDDNDGIPDVIEGGVDEDGNGLADASSTDTDSDGTPDVYDLDSDNDGILDNMEARLDRAAVIALDLNPNGAIDISFPVGQNGIPDVIETSPDSGVLIYTVPDTDNDGILDFRDRDSDNDGIYDVVEAGGVDNDTDGRTDGFYDSDGKGVDDTVQATALPLFDTDGDGVLDFRDTDSDNDTVPDRVEAGSNPSQPTDTDADGAGDYRESDSDGDGVGDRTEVGPNPDAPLDSDSNGTPDYQDPSVITDNGNGGTGGGDNGSNEPNPPANDDPIPADYDGDGVPNSIDLDDDNDSVLDSEEGLIDANADGIPDAGSRDSDSDGTPDGLDLDTDNDGILDVFEARLPANEVAQLDPLGDGVIDSTASVNPVSANGVVDSIETAVDSGIIYTPLLDTDSDGTPNFMDTDSDADGIADIVEAGGEDDDYDGRVDYFEDIDNRGVDDKLQASMLPIFDTDNDGVRDYLDLDSDNDTLPDSVESGGFFVWPTDSDQDGADDYRETDSDNDGVSDTIEAGPNPLNPIDTNDDELPDYQDSSMQFGGTGNGGNTDVPGTDDTDGDGVINSQDADDDNDGITDVIEGTGDNDSDGVPNYLDRDSDNDGVLDSRETAVDTDSDGVPDYLDLDSDNDGAYDALEAGRDAVANTGRLASSASVDSFGLAQGASDARLDTDSDGVVDMLDLDSDNDSLLDVIEQGYPRADVNGRITPFVDQNGDGADDTMTTNGSTLRDTDGDRVPDIRDLDSDQDGLSDLLEMAGPSMDQDNSGTVDNFVDANGDGWDDNVSANPTPLTDTDNDGNPNSTDLDSDNDGVGDLTEAGGTDNNGDNRNDLLNDSDLDGIPDRNDVDFTGGNDVDGDGIDDAHDVDFVNGPDSDGDGVIDSEDPDSDGNGFAGPVNDGNGDGLSQGDPITLPDSNNDGIPDVNQNPAGNSTGVIETGLGGSGFGCSIASVGSASKTDPMIPLLLGGSLMFLAFRLKRRQIARAALVASTAVLASCSTLGIDLDFGRSTATDPDFENRFYVGAGVLMSQLEPNTDNVAGTSVSESESSGASVTLGYDVSNRISVEGHYADLGEATLSPAGTVGYSVAGLSALYYGINDERDRSRRTGLSAYGKLGVGTLQNEVSDVEYRQVNDVHLLAGVGVEYGLDNGLAVRGELTSHETDAKYAQLGLVYRFDSNSSRPSLPPPAPEEDLPAVAMVEFEPMPEPEPLPLDSDFDGVADLIDECPTSLRGTPVKSDGCAVFDGVIEGINFEINSDRLTADALVILEGVAQTLRDFPDVRVTVEAHTDNQGTATSNLQLSKRRAISVSRYLVDQGIAGSRLKPQAFGESNPRTSNATKEGRAANRRVEFSIL